MTITCPHLENLGNNCSRPNMQTNSFGSRMLTSTALVQPVYIVQFRAILCPTQQTSFKWNVVISTFVQDTLLNIEISPEYKKARNQDASLLDCYTMSNYK
jgi:hypothetical protein